jgi:hypothetical protein
LKPSNTRCLSELNATLAEKLPTYTENHPVIIDLRQTIAALSSESPQVVTLRGEVKELQSQFDQRSAKVDADSLAVPVIAPVAGGSTPRATPPPLPNSIIRIDKEPNDERDPAMVYAHTQLKDAMEKYYQLRSQIEAVQIASDTAEAAFKYRYSIIDPPSLPKKPIKPNALFEIAGLVAGLLVALAAAVAADLRTGRFVEAWQIEQALDLPILTDIDVRALADRRT